MPINEQRISDILADNRSFFDIYIVNVVNQVYAFALTTISRFDNPHIFLAFVLLELLVVIIEVSKFFR